MAESRNRIFSKLAKGINIDGDIISSGIAPTVELGGGVTMYDSISLLPYVDNTEGDKAFVNATNRLYLWDGNGWYNVALVQRSPIISSITDSGGGTTPFTLATDGATQTIITIVAADSDGDALTYTVTKGSGFDSIASLSQDSSVFTITPLSEDSAGVATSGTLTFQVTDGINTTTSAAQTFSLTFSQYYFLSTPGGGEEGDGTDSATKTSNGLATATVGGVSAFDLVESTDFLKYEAVHDWDGGAGKNKFVWAIRFPDYSGIEIGLSNRDNNGNIMAMASYTNKIVLFDGYSGGNVTGAYNTVPALQEDTWYIMTMARNHDRDNNYILAKTPGGSKFVITAGSSGGYSPAYSNANNTLVFFGDDAGGVSDANIAGYVARTTLPQQIAGVALYEGSMSDSDMLDDFDTAVFGN